MDKREILALLKPAFVKLGFKKSGRVFWLALDHIEILFECQFSAWSRRYNLTVGIWFVGMDDVRTAFSADSCHLTHSLSNILMKFGFTYDEIDRLLDFTNVERDMMEARISALFEMTSVHVLPYLKCFDDYTFLDKHFAKRISFKPFFVLYHHPDYFQQFFKRNIRVDN